MPKRNLRVLKWMGMTPALAACTLCKREFKVPLESLKSVAGAQKYLQLQFTQHECEKAPDAPVG